MTGSPTLASALGRRVVRADYSPPAYQLWTLEPILLSAHLDCSFAALLDALDGLMTTPNAEQSTFSGLATRGAYEWTRFNFVCAHRHQRIVPAIVTVEPAAVEACDASSSASYEGMGDHHVNCENVNGSSLSELPPLRVALRQARSLPRQQWHATESEVRARHQSVPRFHRVGLAVNQSDGVDDGAGTG
jgi:hypothetical protein